MSSFEGIQKWRRRDIAVPHDEQPTGAQLRRERLRQEMRETILDAARKITSEQGAEALTMRAVASAIGYSPAALYEYYPSKVALLNSLFFSGAEGLAGALQRAIEGAETDNPRDLIRIAGDAYREYALAHPDLYLLIFSIHAPEQAADSSGFDRYRKEAAFIALLDLVKAGVASGDVRPVDPHDTAMLLWSFVHGFVMLELTGQGSADRAERDRAFMACGRLLAAGWLGGEIDMTGWFNEGGSNGW